MDYQRLEKLWRQIRNNPARFGVVVSVVAVGLLLWGRLILLERVPRIATADPDKKQQSADDTPSPPESDQIVMPSDRHDPIFFEHLDQPALQSPSIHADDRDDRSDK